MKTLLIITALTASIATFACTGKCDNAQRALETLDLTPAQKTQITTIRNETRAEHHKLMDQLDDLHLKSKDRVLAVLTPEQKKAFLQQPNTNQKEQQTPLTQKIDTKRYPFIPCTCGW